MIEEFLALHPGEKIGLALALSVVLWCLAMIIWSAWCEVRDMVGEGYPPELLDTSVIVEQAGIRRPLSPSRNMEGAAQAGEQRI